MRRRLRSYDCVMEEAADTPSVFRLRLPIDIPPELLSHPLPEAKRGERGQECLHFLRGAVLEGLRRKFIGRAFSMQGKLATTYAADYDIVMNKNVLLVRNIECSTAEGFVLELEVPPEHMETFRAAFLEAAPHTPEGTTASSVDGIPDPTDKTAPPSAPDTTRKIPTPETTPAAPVPPLDLHVDGPQRIADGVNAAINAIPVQQPDAPATDPAGRVILRDALAPDSDPKQVGAILDAIPGVAEAIRQLDAVTPKTEIPGGGDNDPLKQYAQWRNDLEHFYGQASQDAGYLTGTHLAEILGRMDRAAIDNVVAKPDEKNSPEDTALLHMRQLRSALGSLIERLAPPNDEIQDFELVLSPTEIQLSKLSMLRLYLRLTTDAILPNDLFVYTGTGSKGINIAQKAIGLHAELLNVSFQEALRTMVHEVAHNAAMDHENHFRHTMEALFATIIQRLSTIARTPAEKRTEADKAILELEQKWDATSEEGRRDQV